jgi:chemotaxis protein methyltransferase WspC
MASIDFELLLKEAMGLDAQSLGPTAVARAVQARQAVCKIDDAHGYWMRLRSSPSELQELVEAVVVPETWFFRDREAYAALADMAQAELREQPGKTELRLLSLPCSSGEEPFSMAIALLDAGIVADRIRIDAVDISRRALEQAGRANYGLNSFRGQDVQFRSRHFRSVEGRWQLSDAVRQRVAFRQGNLFAADFLPGSGGYDFIFCRNVLIYFDRDTQARAISVLLRLLGPRGRLFVGPSETGLLPPDQLRSVQWPMAFAFRRTTPALLLAVPKPKPKPKPEPMPAPSLSARQPPTGKHRPPPRPVAVPTRRATDTRVAIDIRAANGARALNSAHDANEAALALVRGLANQGRLQEATAAGEHYLREHGASARGYCLLGLIRDASGELNAAMALYRKALYLEPQHQEALTHLALLLERQGNAAAARVLRERLQRLATQATG